MAQYPPIPVKDGTLVTDFGEYTFRAPRAGFFVGDYRTPKGRVNPIRLFRFHSEIPGPRDSQPSSGSILLKSLPLEIFHQILSMLDVCSVVAFAATDVAHRVAVHSLPSLQAIVDFPNLLGAVLYMRCRSYSLANLAACVVDARCQHCGEFGDVLYLVDIQRLCYRCWRLDHRRLLLVTAKSRPHLKEDALAAGVPYSRVPPGFYGSMGLGVARAYLDAFDRDQFTKKFGYGQKGVQYNICTSHGAEPSIFTYCGAIRAPYFDQHTQSWEEGFCCRACAHQGGEHVEDPDKVPHDPHSANPYPGWGLPWRRYTRDGMQLHIQQYGRIFKILQADGSVR